MTATAKGAVARPTRSTYPADTDEEKRLARLVGNVTNALRALPGYFKSPTNIEGLAAADLFSLNSVLGGTIEVQVVETLNRIRDVWDPRREWLEHRFVRSSQSFPDVRLVREGSSSARTDLGVELKGNEAAGPAAGAAGSARIDLGVELKGWYLLAKEAAPSFRYRVTPAACGLYDLITVVPWFLSNVLSGTPVVREPYIEQAKYAAEWRNYWWKHVRQVKPRTDTGIVMPTGPDVHPYPPPRAQTSDQAKADAGGNFGRLARVHLQGFDDYIDTSLRTELAGIEARQWVTFLRTQADARDPNAVYQKLQSELEAAVEQDSHGVAKRAVAQLRRLVHILSDQGQDSNTE